MVAGYALESAAIYRMRRTDGSIRRNLPVDARLRRHHLDRTPVLFQFRQWTAPDEARWPHEESYRPRVNAPRALLVPMGSGIHLDHGGADPVAGLLPWPADTRQRR